MKKVSNCPLTQIDMQYQSSDVTYNRNDVNSIQIGDLSIMFSKQVNPSHNTTFKGNRHKPDLKIRFWCVYIP